MRKILITLLMASAAATPAIAAGPRHDSDRQQTREERQQARQESRAERAASNERAAPADRGQAQRPQFQQRAERPQRSFDGPERAQVNMDAFRAQQNARRQSLGAAREERVDQRAQTVQQLRDDRSDARAQRADARELRQAARPDRAMSRNRPPVISDVPRPGTQPPPIRAENHRSSNTHWSGSWRNDSRYDWQNRRRHHRSLFHLGFYYDPYGWGYQPFSIGWRVWPSYYGRNYWIDPAMYGLPYAPAGYVWVRYWNDALLIDTWSGQVEDVIPNFFW